MCRRILYKHPEWAENIFKFNAKFCQSNNRKQQKIQLKEKRGGNGIYIKMIVKIKALRLLLLVVIAGETKIKLPVVFNEFQRGSSDHFTVL